MTRCLNLLAIAAIAAATFSSTLAQTPLHVEITGKMGTVHKFDDIVFDQCKKFPTAINAVGASTTDGTCTIYASDNCTSTTESDHEEFSTEPVKGAAPFLTKSIKCINKLPE